MSGTLLAYGDKVIGVVARDNGSVSITADGVKTYSALFDELFAKIDFSKISEKSVLFDSDYTYVYSITRLSNSVIVFGRINTASSSPYISYNEFYLRTSGSLFLQATPSSRTDKSSQVPSASTVFKIIY